MSSSRLGCDFVTSLLQGKRRAMEQRNTMETIYIKNKSYLHDKKSFYCVTVFVISQSAEIHELKNLVISKGIESKTLELLVLCFTK